MRLTLLERVDVLLLFLDSTTELLVLLRDRWAASCGH